MKKFILFSFLIIGLFAQSQTKLIAHKSHSGSVKNFSKAYKNNLFDINRSNFGNPNIPLTQILDSVIAINETTTILVYRIAKFCLANHQVGIEDLKPSDFTYRKDTLYNHTLLNPSNSVQYIKSRRKIEYSLMFTNEVNDVKFVGFSK